MGYSISTPLQVPLLSTKIRELVFNSHAMSCYADARVRTWRKQNESMDSSCIVAMAQAAAGGVMVWGIFSWHRLGSLIRLGHRLCAIADLSIVADHVNPIMAVVFPSLIATSSRIMCHLTKHTSYQAGSKSMTMSSVFSNGLHNLQMSSQHSTLGMLWNESFAAWTRSGKICSDCMVLAHYYGTWMFSMYLNINYSRGWFWSIRICYTAAFIY